MSESWNAIAALIFSYAELLDLGDFAGVAGLFDQATYRTQGRPPRHGAEEVLAVLQQLVALYDGIPRTKHVTTNLVVEIDEGAGMAKARSYFTVFQATDGLPLQPIIAGRYHDSFARVAGIWRYSDRLIFIDLVGDLRYHLKQPVT